jgi:hypothetical protein
MRSARRRGQVLPRRWLACVVGVFALALSAADAGLPQGLAPTAAIKPVPLPDPKIPGFVFPEKEATILGWVTANDEKAIDAHTWGIWTALTEDSGETFEGQKLRVFETWNTPGDLQDIMSHGASAEVGRDPRPLTLLRQLNHSRTGVRALSSGGGQATVTGFVKYDPSGAEHILKHKLLSATALEALLAAGKTQVPDFPVTAISTKPVFQTLTPLIGGQYFQLAVWHGPPTPPKPYPSSEWGSSVWIDTKDTGIGAGNGSIDMVGSPDGSSRTAATTYGLGRFIHFQLSSTQSAAINAAHAAIPGLRARRTRTGDYAALVGMHVTSREIKRWTWQTFWWAPDPNAPPAPSSTAIASHRPAELKGAPRHYAAAIAYQMEVPSQPNTGGENVGNSVYAYNPYLEAPFSPTDLPTSQPGTFNGQPVANNVGVQTNCMSCHAQASFSTIGPPNLYTGDRYIDLDGPQFNGNLKVDFLWSISDQAQ